MYVPPLFDEPRPAMQHGLIRAHPLGLLITTGAGGLLANPVPFLLDTAVDGAATLRTHVARANPQWREIGGSAESLVVFQGPQDYVTPSWYATKQDTGKVVPTWNYATVHCWGVARAVEDAAWLEKQITELTAMMEGHRTLPWAVADAPAPFVAAQIRGIVGIEIPISRIEGKWKMSQNRSEPDRQGVIAGYKAEDNAIMASLVDRKG